MAHPLGQQCTATAKATGSGVSAVWSPRASVGVHGLGAKQVRQKQEQRLAMYDAQVAAAQEPVVLQRREAEEVLIDLLDNVIHILAQINSELHGNVVSPALLAVAGEWMDRTAGVASSSRMATCRRSCMNVSAGRPETGQRSALLCSRRLLRRAR